MKAMNNVNGTKKVLIAVAALFISLSTVNAQGKLVETAMKLFSADKKEAIHDDFRIINATYAEEVANEKSFSLKNLNFELNGTKDASSAVLESFTTKSLKVGYEEALTTESWMTETFEVEPAVETEAWMTETFEVEPAVETEAWMSETFEVEPALEVEAWMSETFEIEPALEVEAWMSEDLSEHVEDALVTEEWMTEPLVKKSNLAGGESELNVEPWMLSLFSGQERISEKELTVEKWMTEPLTTSANENELRAESWMMKPMF